jgi:hypothetical protein
MIFEYAVLREEIGLLPELRQTSMLHCDRDPIATLQALAAAILNGLALDSAFTFPSSHTLSSRASL